MEIKLSKYKFSDEGINHFKNEYIVVDSKFERPENQYLGFDSCTFQFTSTGRLSLDNVDIKNCIFQGVIDLETFDSKEEQLKIINCKVQTLKFTQQFKGILILNSTLRHFTDESITGKLMISNSNLIDFKIFGITSTIHLVQTVFQTEKDRNSIFGKKIILEAICNKVTFDDVKINPFYLATKCYDKSTLDITRATLVDDWSKLRKRYAGLSLFIIFLLTFLFFLPILTHSFFLLTLTKLNNAPINFENVPLWKALLYGGKTGWQAFGYSLLTFILLFYNIGRLYLTITVSKLREEENFLKDANFSLVSIHPDKIKTLLKIDRILSILFWISIGYSCLKLFDTLLISVPTFR